MDTGFTGQLTRPPSVVAAMGLPLDKMEEIKLANDSPEQVPVHLVTIVGEGQELTARVIATGRKPLFGTALMDGKELVIQFNNNGLMTLDNF